MPPEVTNIMQNRPAIVAVGRTKFGEHYGKEPEKLIEEAINVANKIGAKGKIAIKMVKEVAIKGSMLNFNLACELESKEFGNLFSNGESGEGMNAFLEKRKPNW